MGEGHPDRGAQFRHLNESVRRLWPRVNLRWHSNCCVAGTLASSAGDLGGHHQKGTGRIDIAVHHLPPNASKWNSIEHRLFSFVPVNWKARPLVSCGVIVDLVGATTTQTGLTVRCEPGSGICPKGTAVSDQIMQGLAITRNPLHGEWNYTIHQQPQPIRAVNSG